MRSAEYIAQQFAKAYTDLAPQHGQIPVPGYVTVPWHDDDKNNQVLLTAIFQHLLGTCISCTVPDKFVQVFDPPIEVAEPITFEHGMGSTQVHIWGYDDDGSEIPFWSPTGVTMDTITMEPLNCMTRLARVVVIG